MEDVGQQGVNPVGVITPNQFYAGGAFSDGAGPVPRGAIPLGSLSLFAPW